MIYAPSRYKSYGQGIHIFDPCVILKPEQISLASGVRIDSFTKINGGEGVTIGENCHISSFCEINAGAGTVIFGAHSGCSSHVVICGGMTDIAMLATTPQDGNVAKRMVTTIGSYVCIFAGAIILPGVTLGDKCIIAAGAVVTKDVPRRAVIAGVPGKIVGYRSITKEAGA